MRKWELRCYLPDGEIAAVEVNLTIVPSLIQAIGSTPEQICKHKLYDAYLAVNSLIEPNGPELPAHVAEALK